MKLIRFEFDCSSQVPWYSHLCNQYLNYQSLNITIGVKAIYAQADDLQSLPVTWRYVIEAEGEQAPLEQLADSIAHDFLISTYLLESRIIPANERIGGATALAADDAIVPFCQHCQPQFGDNQHPQFANIALTCDHCHGEQLVKQHPELAALQPADLVECAKKLLVGESVRLTDVHGEIEFSRDPIDSDDYAILVCNPNTLSQQFILENRQVLSLSSIEKPLLALKPTSESGLNVAFMNVGFAASRLQQVVCELLRVKGVDWIYCAGHGRSTFSSILGVDTPIKAQSVKLSQASTGKSVAEPLHENARFGDYEAVTAGSRKQPSIKVRFNPQSEVWNSTNSATAAECATLGIGAEFGVKGNYAVLYFSQQFDSKIVIRDEKGAINSFLTLPRLPLSGADIDIAMQASEHAGVWQKFHQKHPDIHQKLQHMNLSGFGNIATLDTLWAVAAVLIGIDAENPKQLAQAFVANAMANRSANSPRIDYPLTTLTDGTSSFDWTKTLGTLVSFRLAGDEDEANLAFALNDSLADFIANWIERLDLNTGINRVYLAGDSMSNALLVKRLGLRLGKNVPIACSQQQDLDGALLATGALYLRQRRG